MSEEKNVIEVYSNCYAEHGLPAAIDGAAAAGLKHLEVAMKTHGGELVVMEDGILSDRASAEEIRRLKARLVEKGLAISSANGGADMREREGVDLVKKRLAVAAQVGAEHFVIAGMHYDREATIRNHFREVADCAREHGMTVALETHPTLMHNADEILRTIDFFAHDAIRVNFDTANVYYHNESSIDMLKELERVKLF